MNFVDVWNKYKMWLAPFASLFLWGISVIAFVWGLSFKNPLVVYGFDATMYIAFGLSVCNTIIQLIGNGMKIDGNQTDNVFFWIWVASYALGISSNTNTLLQILSIESKVLEWIIALALGAIIEIAPEKMILMWLKSIVPTKRFSFQGNHGQQTKPNNGNRPWTYPPVNTSQNNKQNKGNFQHRQELEKNRQMNTSTQGRRMYEEPTYHPVGMDNEFAKLAREVLDEQKKHGREE